MITKIILGGLEVKLDMKKLFLFLQAVAFLTKKERCCFKDVVTPINGDSLVEQLNLVRHPKWQQ